MTDYTKPPTDRQLRAWWAQSPDGLATICGWCGREGSKSLVQPQHPSSAETACRYLGRPKHTPPADNFVAMCHECLGRWSTAAKSNRQAYLDSLPRCEVSGCNRRATYTAAAGVGLCGAHLRRVDATHQQGMSSGGGLMLFMPAPRYSREDILRMAVTTGGTR